MEFEFPDGPRLIYKRDEESSIGRGAVIRAHLRTHRIADMERAACAAAPFAIEEVWVTEGWRPPRDNRRDRHAVYEALDFTFRRGDFRATVEEYEQAAQRMRLFLGPDYDVIVHGEGSNLHIHCEYDPKR